MWSTVTFLMRIAVAYRQHRDLTSALSYPVSNIDVWSMNWWSTLKTSQFGLYDFHQHFTGTFLKLKRIVEPENWYGLGRTGRIGCAGLAVIVQPKQINSET